ncbi:MAG: phage holin family protein [Candidatus Obscuribacterales bacterium]|nr:phage holin family protein [Candidatus Obscuribacterales bacterium]
MKRFIIRLVLSAGAFYFVFPMIQGVHFHGNFFHALLAGFLFALLGWIIELGAIAVSAILTIGTLGMALFILIPVWLIGFWLLPAVVLRLVADFMPSTLVFSGWVPAIWGGLIMLFIGIITSGDFRSKVAKRVTSHA